MENVPTNTENLYIKDKELLEKIYDEKILYRSTGIILENFSLNSENQLTLFADNELENKKEKLSKCFDKLENKFGKNIIKIGFTI